MTATNVMAMASMIIITVMIISMIVGFVRWLKFDARTRPGKRSKTSMRSQRSME
jgi:hypothetical protein